MDKYSVSGMSCAACQAHVEKAVNKVEGVDNCSVSLLTNSMVVEGVAKPEDIIKAVEDAGYGAQLFGDTSGDKKGKELNSASSKMDAMEDMLRDKETPILKKRLISSVILLLALMYFSMGVTMFGWPAPKIISENMIVIGIIEMVLALIIMFINKKFFVSGYKSARHGAPNMDSLVALGSGISFVYSVIVLINMALNMNSNPSSGVHGLYFESAAMIVTLITIGKLLESISKGRTTNALKALISLSPKKATIIVEGKEKEIEASDVQIGDIFVVKAGEIVPVDGVVIDGEGAVDESSLTGESIPVFKEEGAVVSAATMNKSGFLKCRATRVGEDTTLSKIIELVSEASATKAPIAKIADKVSGIFVPSVIAIAFIVFIIWMVLGADLSTALSRAITVLVVSCPCALGLATPVAIMVGNGKGARNGILFKTSASLEELGRVNIVALDKTGTITKGEPKVTDIYSEDIDTLLIYAYSLEIRSEHPLARAICDYALEKEVEELPIDNFTIETGSGLHADIEGREVFGGSYKYISTKISLSGDIKRKVDEISSKGQTPLLFTRKDKFLGIIAVADVIKEDSADAIKHMKEMGLSVVMLTGDNQKTAAAIGKDAGVDKVISDVYPADKEKVIRTLKKYGKVAMVGDGINDAPSITSADVGIAIGAGSDIAIDAASVVLMKSSLLDAAAAIRLSRRTLLNIHENLFWAFFYNILLIPLAAGAYIKLGLSMNPMFGAAAMSLSSFTVCMNALRLGLVDIYSTSFDKKKKNALRMQDISENLDSDLKDILSNEIKTNKKEIKNMTKTMKIEGMMCEHCENRVKKALEKLDGVESANVSHKDGTAVVEMSADVSSDALKDAVEEQDYKVVSVE